jgi:hypothetical protein
MHRSKQRQAFNYLDNDSDNRMSSNVLPCRFCGSNFYSSFDLNNHVNYYHSAIKGQNEYYSQINGYQVPAGTNDILYDERKDLKKYAIHVQNKSKDRYKKDKYRSDKDNFNFLPVSGRLQDDILATLFFAGVLQNDSLTGDRKSVV